MAIILKMNEYNNEIQQKNNKLKITRRVNLLLHSNLYHVRIVLLVELHLQMHQVIVVYVKKVNFKMIQVKLNV